MLVVVEGEVLKVVEVKAKDGRTLCGYQVLQEAEGERFGAVVEVWLAPSANGAGPEAAVGDRVRVRGQVEGRLRRARLEVMSSASR